MKPKQIKLIKSLYKSADYEQKEKIKECFPEVFKLPSEGWVKSVNGSIIYKTGRDSGFGINLRGIWENCRGWSFRDLPEAWQPATESEVKEMLIEEAKRRGVWDCPMKNSAQGGSVFLHPNGDFKGNAGFYFEINELWSKYGLVFDNGKWATPIEETPNEKEDFETLYKKLKTKVTFSNEVILEIDGKRIKITLID
jgi:hypothetical protein